MDYSVNFIFQGKLYAAEIVLDLSEDPCFVFAFLHDDALIERFGGDIDIKTDCEKVLPGKILDAQLLELKTAILSAVKHTDQFKLAIDKRILNSRMKNDYRKGT